MTEANIQKLKFDDNGLIPAIVQDEETGEVLMLAYMNSESLAQTLQTGETWFWSRTRGELWHKGATSGNTQSVRDIRLDCDGDTILVRVRPRGPACHTGERTCFFQNASSVTLPPGAAHAAPSASAREDNEERHRPLSLVNAPAMDLGIHLQDLFTLIEDRREKRPENSYTTYLFNSGLDKILKKVGEEAAETIIAAKNDEKKELTSELTDLLYHLLVLMVEREVSLRDVVNELGLRATRQKKQP